MSYRTYVNNIQIFGNNEWFEGWIEFIKNQGIEVDEEGCYEGYITNFMEALIVIEKETMKLVMERKSLINGKSLFDWSNIENQLLNNPKFDNNCNTSLFDELLTITKNGYAFMPYAFYFACKELLEPDNPFSTPNHLHCYKLRDGCRIHVSAS